VSRGRGALVLLVASAACAGPSRDVYPAEVVRNFMDACTRRSDERVCRCALDTLQGRFTLEEFRAFEAEVRAGEVPKPMVDAVGDCAP
jgi:hypothetical protein